MQGLSGVAGKVRHRVPPEADRVGAAEGRLSAERSAVERRAARARISEEAAGLEASEERSSVQCGDRAATR